MSNVGDNATFSLKVVINKQRTKVLFADIGSDFADVLFSFLTFPLGTAVGIINNPSGGKAPVFGSISTLYNGLSNLDNADFKAAGCKQMLLEPVSSSGDKCRQLKLDVSRNQPTKIFMCENKACPFPKEQNIGVYFGTAICDCGSTMNREITLQNSPVAPNGDGDENGSGVFTVSTAAFIVTDDLKLFPNETKSIRKIISNLGIVDLAETESINVVFGFSEIVNLLRSSLTSPTPLTDVILKKQTKFEQPGIPFSPIAKKKISDGLGGLGARLKVTIQKSTQKLLFAEADEDFVDFLFSLLAIPLGGVECLLESNSGLKNIDNLYESIAGSIDERYLIPSSRTMAIKPNIPHSYLTKKHLSPLVKGIRLQLNYVVGDSRNEEYFRPCYDNGKTYIFKYLQGQENYVKGPRMYMVKDDLTVTPLSITSYISTLNAMKIPMSDVDEVELHIGLEEALSILKASLSSTCALSNGLHHLLMKQPKQEH